MQPTLFWPLHAPTADVSSLPGASTPTGWALGAEAGYRRLAGSSLCMHAGPTGTHAHGVPGGGVAGQTWLFRKEPLMIARC